MDNLFSKLMPMEQSRWNQQNIDHLFYSGHQQFANRYLGSNAGSNSYQYYFNIAQQPVNMITGYERQHRKGFMCQGIEGADDKTCDQYTKLLTNMARLGGIHDIKSRAKELAAISGMALVQPYLDYTCGDQAQGECKVKIWEYNSFLIDPYFRNLDMSDAQTIWCQEYISKPVAEERFGDKVKNIVSSLGGSQTFSRFYFLPENYNLARTDLMVVSYIWYKWKVKKKRLYSERRNQFFDFAGKNDELDMLMANVPDLEEVEVEVPAWKLATVLNDQLMFQGENPLSFTRCPFVMYGWNYEPYISYPELRVRGLIRTMRDPQFLFNYKVIQNNDIAAATINAGWKRKVGAVANEDNLKKAGQGWDVIINDGYEMTDVEKIIPSAVPESDLALAQQMQDLIYNTSGINLENWSGQEDKQTAALTVLLKQAANLMVFQKYFDQWDFADSLLGELLLEMSLYNWNAEKIELVIGEEPSPLFFSKIFAKYKVVMEESDLTPTQQNLQAQQMLEINERFGKEVFSPSMIIPKLNITGKAELIKVLQGQEQQMMAAQDHEMHLTHAVEEAKLKELYAKTANQIATARERHGRAESNIGLFEERLSMIGRNNAMSAKAKTEALEKLVEVTHRYGELEAHLKMNDLNSIDLQEQTKEDVAKDDAKRTSLSNDFVAQMLAGMGGQNQEQDQAQGQ